MSMTNKWAEKDFSEAKDTVVVSDASREIFSRRASGKDFPTNFSEGAQHVQLIYDKIEQADKNQSGKFTEQQEVVATLLAEFTNVNKLRDERAEAKRLATKNTDTASQADTSSQADTASHVGTASQTSLPSTSFAA